MTEEILNALPEEINITGIIESGEVFLNGEYLSPDLSQRIRNHSPDGFMWGYGGSGPAQLALALLLEFMPVNEALNYYQDLKFWFVAALPQTNFDVTINLREEITAITKMKIIS